MEFSAPLRTKLPKTGTTIFTVMNRLAAKHNAINLAQGFPDFPCHPDLINLVSRFMQEGRNQYAPMQGLPALREAIAEKTERCYSATPDPETEITITPGGTYAIFTAISAVVNEGDEVIIFEPAYDCYSPGVELNGGVPIYIEMEPPAFAIPWEKVKKCINHRTRMIIINTPHNPTGTALNAFDMLQLEKLTRDNDIIILSDEVYEHIIFDGLEHQSVLRYPRLANRSFVVSSFGKTYHVTGWKVGYCIAPAKLMAEFRKVHQYLVFSVNTPVQYALAEFLKRVDQYLDLGKFYQKKRDFFLDGLRGSPYLKSPATGTYFQLLNFKKVSSMPDKAFAEKLVEENRVTSIPVSVFYHKATDYSLLRFCFAKTEQTLENAISNLLKL